MAAATIFLNFRRTKRTMDRIEAMLDAAAKGEFFENAFDESRLSALETKFAHYLSATEVSARSIAVEKDKINTLISDISHQTKTPVSNLLLYSELLAEQKLPAEAEDKVAALHYQAEKLHFLIDSLVKLSRLENGILVYHPEKQPLDPLLQKVWEQFLPKAEAKGLFFRLELPKLSAVYDLKWTNEALCNLVENAVKYTEQGGVTIKAKEYELFACIEVMDTGIGIEEEEQSRIFTRFYRSQKKIEEEGVGVGLYLAREIISGQGGYIRLSSGKEGGSVFSVFLPHG